MEADILWIKGALERIELGQKELHSDNDAPRGITWDGAYLYVVDAIDDNEVYVYDADGTYVG